MKDAAWLTLCVIRVERPQAADTKRAPRISWFVWIGDAEADLVMVGQCYARRFSQEHGYRFDKQSLFWADVRVRTPAQSSHVRGKSPGRAKGASIEQMSTRAR